MSDVTFGSDLPEVEICREMIEAGAEAICGTEPGTRYAPAGCDPDDPEEVAAKVYRAMEFVRLSRARGPLPAGG